MPINPTYPGVYIEELENPVKTIVGVSTSVTAFVGRALQGPVDKPILIHNFGEFQSIFGGLWKPSTMSYAVYQYFLNGGMDAVIVRVFNPNSGKTVDDAKAKFESGKNGIKFVAKNPGVWANNFSVVVDSDVDKDQDGDPKHLFNLKVKKNDVEESFLNVSARSDHKRYVVTVLKEESDLIEVVNSTISHLGTLDAPSVPTDDEFLAKEGDDGTDLGDGNITGNQASKTGMYALDNADIFNLLCIPPPDPSGQTDPGYYSGVYTNASEYCKKKRAMLVVDPPSSWNSKDDPLKPDGIDGMGLSRSENAVIYFPRIRAPDPNEENRLREFPPCGAIAGMMAKTDAQRGIWKAPAGIDAILTGVPDLTVRLTDEENGDLNQRGINCLRILPAGRVVWGARTMKGADRLTNQWKYLPIRRTALYIEETLYRNTQWAVFEPNDEPLWSQIRLSIGSFMHDLFSKGAFQGSTPKEAYLVKCDKETTTQYDIDRGIVNILVGFAPLKPAEFVMIKIQQLAGQKE